MDWYSSYKEIQASISYYPYGWIDPKGVFYACPNMTHTEWVAHNLGDFVYKYKYDISELSNYSPPFGDYDYDERLINFLLDKKWVRFNGASDGYIFTLGAPREAIALKNIENFLFTNVKPKPTDEIRLYQKYYHERIAIFEWGEFIESGSSFVDFIKECSRAKIVAIHSPHLYQKATYSPQIGDLKMVLENGFSPYDYANHVKDFLNRNPDINPLSEENASEDEWDYGYEWIEQADQEDLDRFEKFTDYVHDGDATFDRPYKYMELNKVMKPNWQIHFTDDPWSIVREGFTQGHSDIDGVHLTTYFKNKAPGFNFGYPSNYRFPLENGRPKYGRHAVLFYAGGLDTYHWGDEEEQTVFWGPYVEKEMIFPIIWDNMEDVWTVESHSGRVVFKSENIENAIAYIKSNWKMLYDIRSKETRRKRH